MWRQLRLVLVATQFLTRAPIRSIAGFDPSDITRSARYFPLVGQAVGGLCALALLAASHLWSSWTAVLLALGVGLLLTGAFHEDGLADTADGLGGGQTADQRLSIMRDSHVGTYGVLALGLVLALKASGLQTMEPAKAAMALIAAHGLGRAAAVVTMRVTPYAPSSTAAKWKPTPEGVTTGEVCVAAVIAAWPLACIGVPGLIGAIAGLILAGMLTRLSVRLIGGHTGDVLGAVEQVFELGFILGVSAAWR